MSASSTRDFAETLLGLAAAGFEPAAEAAARDLLRDGLAVGALGAREAAPQLIASLAREAGGKPDATLFAQSALTRVRASKAVMARGGDCSPSARSAQSAVGWNSKAVRAANRTNRSGWCKLDHSASTAFLSLCPWKASNLRRSWRSNMAAS